MIKVLVVDDSALIRKIVIDILEEDEEIKVVGTARNGKDAIEKISLLKPDVITLDIEMPIMDGISALKEIVRNHKIPVVMLSSLTVKGADLTLKALDIGAVDFVTKPKNIFSIGSISEKNKLIRKVKIASKIRIDEKQKIFEQIKLFEEDESKRKYNNDNPYDNIIAIATSTGGPKALQEVIPKLPYNINGTIVVVQHMPAGFTKSLAIRLNSISRIKVKEGEDNEKLKKGYCYIAPGDFHMNIYQQGNEFFIKLNKEEPISGLRPSADILMNSVSKLNGINKIGIVLTGMGSDGSKGISQIKNKGGYTMAQDEKTSIVFGMPRSAIDTGNIDLVLPLDKFGNEIIKRAGVQ